MEAEHGALASGLIGQGRLPEPIAIVNESIRVLEAARSARSGPLSGKRVVVTAGPTRERLDPVRFLSNHSSGTMGYALAASAARLGADVMLISGPTSLETPLDVHRTDVESTADMHAAVLQHANADIVIMVAAVADYTPAETSASKLKKDAAGLTLVLRPTVDILADLGSRKKDGQQFIGFALETDNGPENARGKLARKNLDWIVLNNPNEAGAGFGVGTNRVTIIGADGSVTEIPLLPKQEVADAILHETVLKD